MVTNGENEQKKKIMNRIKIRKMLYLGHVMRQMRGDKCVLLQNIVEGKIQGRSRGRRLISWLNKLRKCCN